MPSPSTTRRIRARLVGAGALGVVLSSVLTVSPVMSAPVAAQSPAVPSPAPSAPTVTGLERGAKGDAVRTLQQALVNQGVAVAGGVDGVFGPATEAALKQFQSAKGLTATGKVDDATAIALGLASSPFLGLTQGNRGDHVRQMQERIIAAGIELGDGADGIFGPKTAAALKEFQKARGLSATGTVDAATAAALGGVSAAPAASPAPSSQSGSGMVGLAVGSRGDQVKALQQLIIKAGINLVGGADGIFGVITASALRSFQEANGLPVDGVVSEATLQALQAKSGATASPLVGLQYGATGATVKQVQQAIMNAGISLRGGADGIFGTATRDALKQYQAARGLPQTGKVDEATAAAITSGGASGLATPNAMLGLSPGALGTAVKQLQQRLMDLGVTVRGGADGIFGPATANAVKAFQASQGLPQTGTVDDATVKALANPAPAKPAAPADAGGSGGYAVYGEKGARVMALQGALVKAGIAVRGGVDGDFGAGTSAAVMEFQKSKGLKATGIVDEATAKALGLQPAAAPAAPDTSSVKMKVFPVQGRCYFGDSYGYTRGGGRTHLGVDIIAPAGNLLYAVVDGTITKVYYDYPGSLSGNGLRLSTGDGTYYFYAHLSAFADGIGLGSKVKAGQVIGYVGTTGNSQTNHLHFEIHPKGGSAINPYQLVKAIDGCGITDPLPQP